MTDKPQTDCHDANDLRGLAERESYYVPYAKDRPERPPIPEHPENFNICKNYAKLDDDATKRKIQLEAKERYVR